MKKYLVGILVGALLLLGLGVSPVLAQSGSCGSTYTVQPGDYLTGIARQCGVSYTDLLNANPQIDNPNLIYPGQVINIPTEISPGFP